MITQRVRVLNNSETTIEFGDYGLFYLMELFDITALPSWITPSYSPYILKIDLDLVSFSVPNGVYTYSFTTSSASPPIIDAVLEIEVVSSLTDSLETCNNSNAICIVWVTREGGRASNIFDQRKDFGVNTGENRSYDNGGVIKYLSRGKNFDTKTVYKTGVSETEIDLIESLRTSIQAWEYNSDTDVSTPIFLDPGSFPKYNTKVKFNEISFSYRMATYKLIQAQ